MTADDITQIERELGMSVPADYRALVTAYPANLPAEARGYDLLDHPSYIITENRSARRSTVHGIRWPDPYFIIGQDGSGGWFCLDTQRNHSPVIYFDHEDRSFREVAASLTDWLPMISALYADRTA
jgi:cell wall assembly regulator SMI1